jgi:hypothetical protein
MSIPIMECQCSLRCKLIGCTTSHDSKEDDARNRLLATYHRFRVMQYTLRLHLEGEHFLYKWTWREFLGKKYWSFLYQTVRLLTFCSSKTKIQFNVSFEVFNWNWALTPGQGCGWQNHPRWVTSGHWTKRSKWWQEWYDKRGHFAHNIEWRYSTGL